MGESWLASTTASGGTTPLRIWPLRVPPPEQAEHRAGVLGLRQRQPVQAELAARAGHLAAQADGHALLGHHRLGADHRRPRTTHVAPLDRAFQAQARQRRIDHRHPFARRGVGREQQALRAEAHHQGVRAGVVGPVGGAVEGAGIDGHLPENAAVHHQVADLLDAAQPQLAQQGPQILQQQLRIAAGAQVQRPAQHAVGIRTIAGLGQEFGAPRVAGPQLGQRGPGRHQLHDGSRIARLLGVERRQPRAVDLLHHQRKGLVGQLGRLPGRHQTGRQALRRRAGGAQRQHDAGQPLLPLALFACPPHRSLPVTCSFVQECKHT
ncbi:Uncharacterised protein [Bordetella pertussis]|nr:Uncharacterised protein [Bordetella pertussis]